MRLFQYEWRKLASCRLLFYLLVLLLAGNAYLFYNQTQKPPYAPMSNSVYDQLLEEYAEMEPEEALQEISKLESNLNIAGFVDMFRQNSMVGFEGQTEQEAVQDMLDASPFPMEYDDFMDKYGVYIENHEKSREINGAVSSLKEQLNHIVQYPDYILSMAEKRDEMKKASIFNKPGTFSYRNIEKTPEDFKGLENLSLSLGPEDFLMAISTYSGADFCIILLLLLLCIYLFSQEKEKGLSRFIRTMRQGRFPTTLSKLLVLILWAVALCVLFYGTVLIMAASIYNFGDLSRMIQSHPSFRGASIPMSVAQFLMVIFLEKVLVVLACALLFSVVFSLFSGIKIIAVLLGMVFALEYVAYILIAPQSYLNILKYLNFFAFTDSYSLFAQYFNINLFGFPISRITSALCCLLFVMVLMLALYFFFNRWEWNFVFSLPKWRGKKLRPIRGAASLFRQEAFKTFISNKGWIYIAAALAIAFCTTDVSTLYMDETNTLYWSYADMMEGPVDEEHEQILQREADRFSNIQEEMEKVQTAYQNGSLSDSEYYVQMYELNNFDTRREAFDKVQMQFSRLQALEQETGRKLYFINKLQTDYVFQNTIRSLTTAVLFVFLLVLMLSSFYPSDYQSGMAPLLGSMKYGRERLMFYRIGYGILAAVGLLTILTVPHIITITLRYGWFPFTAPVQSIEEYSHLSWNLTVGQFLLLNLIFQYITAVVLALFILAVSNLVKSQSLTILACCMLVLFPLVLKLADISALDWCTLTNGLMIFNGFQNHDIQENLLYYLGLLLVGTVCFRITQKAFCSKKQRLS